MRKNNNTRYRIFLLIALLPVALLASAQKNYDLVAEGGTGFIQVNNNDSLLSPGKINGTGIQTHIGLNKTGKKRKTLLQGSYADVNYSNNNNTVRQHSIGLRLSDGYNILPRKNKYFSWYQGYMIATKAEYSPGNSIRSYSWNSYNVIGWYQSLRYVNKKNIAELDIQVPLVGVVYRTPVAAGTDSKGFDHVLNSVYSNPVFASLHNNRIVDISLQYTRIISDRWQVSAGYQFNYQQWKGENPLSRTANNFGISAGYRFR